ncbi:MAG: hypothetical protein JST90_00775 [Bacteroidetes bacterium]|nr:hypothetical protein [Bacteroidota bacterium]
MLQTKPDQILRCLSQPELNRLDRFMPGARADDHVLACWEYIRIFYKERIPEALSKENVWKAAFGKKKFAALRYARLLSDLTKAIERFLLQEYLSQHDTERNLMLLDIYNTRALPSCAAPMVKAVNDTVSKNDLRDAAYYMDRYRADELQNTFIENLDRRDSEKHLTATMQSLDCYYVIQKLKYYASALHYEKFLNTPSEIQHMSVVLEMAAHTHLSDVPLIRIYLAIIHTLQEKDGDANFELLRSLLSEYIHLFPAAEAEQLYAFAVNYCIRMINQGDLSYVQKILSLYKQQLKDGLLTHSGTMSPWEFKNIVTIALRAKELKWTAEFIEAYIAYIPQRDRSNAYRFNMARYTFAAGKYDRVLELLGSVEYNDVFYQLDAKATLMKTYYELGEYQPLQSLSESFRILLSRKRLISDTQRAVYGNFVRYTLKLFRADVKDRKKMAQLTHDINKVKQLADKSWIMEKLGELST